MTNKEWGQAFKLKYEKIRLNEKDVDLVVLVTRIGRVGNSLTRMVRKCGHSILVGLKRG